MILGVVFVVVAVIVVITLQRANDETTGGGGASGGGVGGPGAYVTFDKPAKNAKSIKPRTNVEIHGKLTGLPAGHKLWLVSKPLDSDFFTVGTKPLLTADGVIKATDWSVGDPDEEINTFVYTALDANAPCDKGIRDALDVSRKKDPDDGNRIGATLPTSCIPLPESTQITVKN
jgi:hypothetical protein